MAECVPRAEVVVCPVRRKKNVTLFLGILRKRTDQEGSCLNHWLDPSRKYWKFHRCVATYCMSWESPGARDESSPTEMHRRCELRTPLCHHFGGGEKGPEWQVTDRPVKVSGRRRRQEWKNGESAQRCDEGTMSAGLRGTQMLNLTICIRLLIDVRCLEVTPEGLCQE
jgi:hypothetical protein